MSDVMLLIINKFFGLSLYSRYSFATKYTDIYEYAFQVIVRNVQTMISFGLSYYASELPM